MPLSALGELLSYAREKEAEQAKLEQEKQLFPLWLSGMILGKLGGKEIMSFEEFLKNVFDDKNDRKATKSKKTTEEIISDFMPIIAADRKKQRKGV